MSDLDIEIDITGDVEWLRNVTEILFLRMEAATLTGAKVLVDEHERIIADWVTVHPDFIIDNAARTPNSVTRSVRIDKTQLSGQIWDWINIGTRPISIIGKRMAFKWEEPDTSYDSSYDPRIDESFGRGTGEQHGKDINAWSVTDRSIHARDFDLKAIERARDDVMRVMRYYF